MTQEDAEQTELITFLQNSVPGLENGTYRLTVSQRVLADGVAVGDETLEQSYTFAVLGDRFRLADPQGMGCVTFPADGAVGTFDTVLPHVVFRSPTFPWSRSPRTGSAGSGEGDVPTWLAVLLLDEQDALTAGVASLEAFDATLGDLFPQEALSGSSLPAGTVSYFQGAVDTSGLEVGDDVDTAIRAIDVPWPLFRHLAPTIEDLSLLAHVRRVDGGNKAITAGDIAEPLGDFAVVFANRLPAALCRSTAHLVSLEGMADLLPAADEEEEPAAHPGSATAVRLAVLASWSFTSASQSASFADTLLELNGRVDGASTDAPVTTLRLAAPGGDERVISALDMGYVPMDHDLRDGGSTVSWYRGPLSPVEEPAPHGPDEGIQVPVGSADQLLRFDPTTGMFDVSYASAWALGRMLAIQDKAFSVALYTWKTSLSRLVVDAVEERVLHGALSPVTRSLAASVLEGRAEGTVPAAVSLAGSVHALLLRTLASENSR